MFLKGWLSTDWASHRTQCWTSRGTPENKTWPSLIGYMISWLRLRGTNGQETQQFSFRWVLLLGILQVQECFSFI